MLDVLVQSGGGGSLPAFALGFKDLGAGAVDTSSQGSAATPTFTRATTAWTKLSSGLWASVASGQARSFYGGLDTTVGAFQGFLAEGAGTNLCLQARDLSNASWTKVNTTGAKDQTGIDGSANSASSLTCTVNGGTCLQTITEAATDSTLSMFIKRITGTGTITIQQGASTSDITAQLNSSTYTRVTLDATVLNPAIGIVMGTSGDVIAVDMVQFENGAFASTPVPTTTVSIGRSQDVLTYSMSGIDSAATFYCEATHYALTGATQRLFQADDGSANNRITAFTAPGGLTTLNTLSGGVVQANLNGITPVAGTTFKYACAEASNDAALSTNGGLSTTGAATLPVGPINVLTIGGGSSAATSLYGGIKNVRIWTKRLSNGQLQAMTT